MKFMFFFLKILLLILSRLICSEGGSFMLYSWFHEACLSLASSPNNVSDLLLFMIFLWPLFVGRISWFKLYFIFNNIPFVLWCRKRLFNMINDFPTVFEVVTGTAKKQVKEKPSISIHSSNKTKLNSKVSRTLRLQLFLVCYICTNRKS